MDFSPPLDTSSLLNQMRSAIETVLMELSSGSHLNPTWETELIFDRDRDLIIDLGWQNDARIYDCVAHLEIRDHQIWIQRNQTDQPLRDRLRELGIADDQIVIGLLPPAYRESAVSVAVSS